MFNVTGTAADDQVVTNVYFNVNNTGWNQASTSDGWNHWTAVATLTPGTNTISAYSVDSSGNQSSLATTRFAYIAHDLMQVSFDSQRGVVTPNYNNALLQDGLNYSMTALAKAGFAFANWTDGNGNLVTNQPVVRFTMASGLALVANFVDITKPTASITNLPVSGIVSNSYFTIQGKASDNVGLANVYYNLNDNGWIPATPAGDFSHWSAGLSLRPGVNYIAISAQDVSGNSSLTTTSRLTYVVSGPLSVQINGNGGIIVPNYNNALLQIGANYAVTAYARPGFAFTNWTDGNGNLIASSPLLRFAMSPNLVLIANFVDIARPLVSVTNLPLSGIVSNNSFTLMGRASDNVQVANVFYQVNNNGWLPAGTTNSWTNWSQQVSLNPGINSIGISAQDSSGNYSLSNTFRLTYVVSGVLHVQTNGLGTVSPAVDGAWLQIGKQYSLTATPGAGCVFSNWTDATGTVLTNRPTLTFLMASNLVFTAQFVDVAKPVLFVSSPLSGTIATAEYFRAYGRASDNAGIAYVRCQLNGGNWYSADLTNNGANWSTILDLTPGTNYFAAYAVDTSGNLSATNLAKFIYNTAPATLVGLKAQVTPDGAASWYEMVFGAGVFSQDSADLTAANGAGLYAYTKLTPNAGVLKTTFTTPPQVGLNPNTASRSFSLYFPAPNQARFTITNDASTGGILFTTTPALVVPNLVNQTLINVKADGTGDSTRFTTVQSIKSDLITRVTNPPIAYAYAAYGPLTAVVKQTSTNGVSYLLATMRGTNYGDSYSEDYSPTGNLIAIHQGVFGLTSQRPAGNAPTNLVNRSALFSSGGDSFQLSFATNAFTQLDPANNLQVEGSGNYTYARVGTNAGNLNLNFVSPSQTSSALFLFAAPNFAVFTNLDTTLGTAIFK